MTWRCVAKSACGCCFDVDEGTDDRQTKTSQCEARYCNRDVKRRRSCVEVVMRSCSSRLQRRTAISRTSLELCPQRGWRPVLRLGSLLCLVGKIKTR